MKKSSMIIVFFAVILFVVISIGIQPARGQKVSSQSLEFINNTKNEYSQFVESSHKIEEIINSFEGLFGIYLEEIPNVYQEYFDKLNMIKLELSNIEKNVVVLNELCNIPFDNKETIDICNNYTDNYQKIKTSFDSVKSTFNETITNYNKLAMYNSSLEEKDLYK
ncbi:MAG: hypothetical protein HFG48_01330 [Bacilli bacterium]|nr:hypothetical protein [Bacilli bacterium]